MRFTANWPVEDDHDEMAMHHVTTCVRFECQTWERNADKPTRPTLVNGKCPKCGASYYDKKS